MPCGCRKRKHADCLSSLVQCNLLSYTIIVFTPATWLQMVVEQYGLLQEVELNEANELRILGSDAVTK